MRKRVRLPERGLGAEAVLAEMGDFGGQDPDYRDGRTWSLVYHLDDEHTDFLKQAFGLFFSENGLNPMAFRSLKRFETEVVDMALGLMNGPTGAAGVMTSGGTESCMLAVKTARDRARSKSRWIKPEMLLPATGHVAFEKAAEYFGVRAVRVPLGRDLRADWKAARRRMNRNTVLVVGSAPCYPFGVVDPIEDLARIARRRGVPMHVDACLGGFLLPFAERIGRRPPAWDFRVPGVVTISADVHKYGFAAKGASVLLHRDMDHLQHQIFISENWPGGVFASPALLGTRPGGAIAAAWAALQRLGEDGYCEIARTIFETTEQLQDGIRAIPGLDILGKPDMSVFAYRSTDPEVNIYAVGDRMEERSWHIDRQQKPESLHAMVTPGHARVVDRYLGDLAEAVEWVRRHPEAATSGNAAMYGMISQVPLRGLIRQQVMQMMLAMYGPEGEIPDLDGKDDLVTRLGVRFLRFRRQLIDALPAKLRER